MHNIITQYWNRIFGWLLNKQSTDRTATGYVDPVKVINAYGAVIQKKAAGSCGRISEGQNMKTFKYGMLIAVFASVTSPNAYADKDDCNDAIEKYNAAINEISYALKKYSDCVSTSKGRYDCSMEFTSLKYAQGYLEDAVSSYRIECD